jgi:CHASE3 domain sensor protein
VTRRFPIRFKLAAALAVPILFLLGVAAFPVQQARQTSQTAGEQAELATATLGFGTLHDSLLTERNITGSYLRGVESTVDLPVDTIEDARTLTDRSLDEFRATIASKSDDIQAAHRPAFDAIDGNLDDIPSLSELRTRVDEFEGERSLLIEDPISPETWDSYTDIVDLLFAAYSDIGLEIDDYPDLRRGARLIQLSSIQAELVAQLVRELVVAQFSSEEPGLVEVEEKTRIGGLRGQLRDNESAIVANGVGPYAALVDDLFESNQIQRFPQVVDAAQLSGEIDIDAMFEYAVSQEEFGYAQFADAVEDELNQEAERVQSAATQQQWLYTGLAAVIFLLAAIVTFIVSRSITRPLRSLTEQASAMANEQLPEAVQQILETPLGEDVTVPYTEPIEVNTRDEVADVAEALDTVQESALELAVEQALLRRNIADSFVNLGRRNQNLLGRQLDFITELEQNETEPDTLANLFRLDHLATRMRRNAESLLVLAGIDPPRKWAAPVQLTDAIRAALGEVEDYQRVTVRAVEPATVVGSVAADLAHLLAELIENALVFSPPDQAVEIRGRAYSPNTGPAGHPDSGTAYTLAVIDSGLGMSPEEITRANRRLAGEESFTIAPSKYLGHYVAGNLAARHGIDVKLQPPDNPDGTGITATISLPAALLTDQVTTDDTAPGAPHLTSMDALAPPAATPLSAPPPPDALPAGQPVESAEPDPFGPPKGPPTPAPMPEPVARTNGGLVKRVPDHVPGDGRNSGQHSYSLPAARAGQPAATVSEELLQTLATYTEQLHRRVNPHRPPTPPGGNALHPFPSSDQGSAVPPSPAYSAEPPPPHSAAPQQMPPPGGHRSSRPPDNQPPSNPFDAPMTLPTAHSSMPQHTSSGLTRRVRGAQMPATDPLTLNRTAETQTLPDPRVGAAPDQAPSPVRAGDALPSDPGTNDPGTSDLGAGSAPPADAGGPDGSGGAPAPEPESATSSARDVYDFLSSFSAGVQRGLDDAGRPRPGSSSEEEQ